MINNTQCNTCKKPMPADEDCGGDCLRCMASFGDHSCVLALADKLTDDEFADPDRMRQFVGQLRDAANYFQDMQSDSRKQLYVDKCCSQVVFVRHEERKVIGSDRRLCQNTPTVTVNGKPYCARHANMIRDCNDNTQKMRKYGGSTYTSYRGHILLGRVKEALKTPMTRSQVCKQIHSGKSSVIAAIRHLRELNEIHIHSYQRRPFAPVFIVGPGPDADPPNVMTSTDRARSSMQRLRDDPERYERYLAKRRALERPVKQDPLVQALFKGKQS